MRNLGGSKWQNYKPEKKELCKCASLDTKERHLCNGRNPKLLGEKNKKGRVHTAIFKINNQ